MGTDVCGAFVICPGRMDGHVAHPTSQLISSLKIVIWTLRYIKVINAYNHDAWHDTLFGFHAAISGLLH